MRAQAVETIVLTRGAPPIRNKHPLRRCGGGREDTGGARWLSERARGGQLTGANAPIPALRSPSNHQRASTMTKRARANIERGVVRAAGKSAHVLDRRGRPAPWTASRADAPARGEKEH